MAVEIRKSAKRLAVLAGMVEDANAGRHYRYALAVEPHFFALLVDGGYVEVREEGKHPLGGPAHHVYLTDKGRDLHASWAS